MGSSINHPLVVLAMHIKWWGSTSVAVGFVTKFALGPESTHSMRCGLL